MSFYSQTLLADLPAAYYRLGETAGTAVNDKKERGTRMPLFDHDFNTPALYLSGADFEILRRGMFDPGKSGPQTHAHAGSHDHQAVSSALDQIAKAHGSFEPIKRQIAKHEAEHTDRVKRALAGVLDLAKMAGPTSRRFTIAYLNSEQKAVTREGLLLENGNVLMALEDVFDEHYTTMKDFRAALENRNVLYAIEYHDAAHAAKK